MDIAEVPAHLANVELHEYTEGIARYSVYEPGRCGDLPARAFWAKYPNGCRREGEHEGPHSAVEKTAQAMDRKARAKGWRPVEDDPMWNNTNPDASYKPCYDISVAKD